MADRTATAAAATATATATKRDVKNFNRTAEELLGFLLGPGGPCEGDSKLLSTRRTLDMALRFNHNLPSTEFRLGLKGKALSAVCNDDFEFFIKNAVKEEVPVINDMVRAMGVDYYLKTFTPEQQQQTWKYIKLLADYSGALTAGAAGAKAREEEELAHRAFKFYEAYYTFLECIAKVFLVKSPELAQRPFDALNADKVGTFKAFKKASQPLLPMIMQADSAALLASPDHLRTLPHMEHFPLDKYWARVMKHQVNAEVITEQLNSLLMQASGVTGLWGDGADDEQSRTMKQIFHIAGNIAEESGYTEESTKPPESNDILKMSMKLVQNLHEQSGGDASKMQKALGDVMKGFDPDLLRAMMEQANVPGEFAGAVTGHSNTSSAFARTIKREERGNSE